MTAMHETEDVGTGEDLARFLDPTGDPFIRLLLQTVAAAGLETRARLRAAFPAYVIPWEVWSQLEEVPSAGELRALAAMLWPNDFLVPDTETIAAMVADYRHGRVTLPAPVTP